MQRRLGFLVALLLVSSTSPARASLHLMQIEQVIGGVNGDTDAQAIQLRMRAAGQNFVSAGRIRAWDAAGANPIVIVDMMNDVGNGAAGSRVLVSSPNFSAAIGPPPDFVMTNLIPASYLAAGSLTWEDDSGATIFWRLSWGDGAYTGSGMGATFNDVDGNFNPPFAGPLPSSSKQALQFQGAAGALSTTNAANYAVTAGDAVFTNNGGQSATVVGVGEGEIAGPVRLGFPAPNPVRGEMSYSVTLSRAGHVRVTVFDLAGRLVRTLVDDSRRAGPSLLHWNPGESRLPSGVYTLRLEAEGVVQARRFALMR